MTYESLSPTQEKSSGSGLLHRLRSSLRAQLGVSFVALAVLPILIVTLLLATIIVDASRAALEEKAFDQLEAVRALKTDEINAWLTNRQGEALFARNLVVVKGTEGVNEGLPVLVRYKDEPTNPAYVAALGRAEQVLSAFAKEIGGGVYDDIMLVDAAGDVLFALDDRSLGTNVLETEEVDPVLFQSGLQSLYVGDVRTNPVHQEVELRVAAPVVDDSGSTVGTIILEADLGVLTNIMQERAGLGESGETYLVGQDELFRNDSRFLEELGVDTTILNPDVIADTVAVQNALAGESGTAVIDDYRGTSVLSSWSPLVVQEPTPSDPDGVRWALVAEIDESEALAPANRLTGLISRLSLILLLVVGVVAVGLGVWIANRLVEPVVELTQNAVAMAAGNLNIHLTSSSENEIGVLTNAFGRMAARLRETLGGLEERVAERTREMELAATVGRRLATVRDLDALLSESVEMVRASFNLYYAQVYLTSADGRSLALRAGTGAAGEQLVARGHRLPVGPGSINGTAAAESRAVIVADTTESATFLPNPLLPHTRSEMSVPLVVGERVVGVLNLQDDRANSLTAEKLPAFEALAGQLAIAINNAELFAETAEAHAETEAYARRLTGEAWEAFFNALDRDERLGYVYEQQELEPLDGDFASNGHTLTVPISVSGEPVGALQLEGEGERYWTDAETALASAVAEQVAQQVESLRLLAETERYRAEAEEAVRRMTREDWGAYISSLSPSSAGYVYDRERVLSLDAVDEEERPALSQPLVVRGEAIGELAIVQSDALDDETAELLNVVAGQLGTYIDSARLLEETERGRQELDKRAVELQTVAEMSATAASILETDRLLQTVVDLTKERFGLYHAHVYLLDGAGDNLVLTAGAGAVGRKMVDQGWQIPLDRRQSLVAQAARTRQGVIVNDVRAEPGFMANPLLPDTRSEMAVPLIVGEKVLGVLDVQSDELDRFTDEDVSIKTTLAGQVATALENARLFEEVQESTQALAARSKELEVQQRDLEVRTRELEASQQVTFAASEHVSPEELLGLVVNLIRDQFDLYHAQVYLVDEEAQAAVLKESTGYAGRQLLKDKHQIPLEKPSVVTRVIRSGEPVLVADVSQDEEWLPNPLLPHTQAELAVPLLVEDRVLGVLDVQSRTTDQLTESSIALFQTMTDQVAFLFENSALLARVTEQTEALTTFTVQLRTAADIAERLSAILDREQLLREAVELMQSRFGFYHAHVYLLDEDGDELVVHAGSGEVGRVLRERGHNIPLDQEKSVVARAARERQTVVVQDTALKSDFMPNPLLPQTRSEVAVPLVAGGQLIGVLDVQDDQAGRFDEADVATFNTLAGQVATALENARLFEAQVKAEQAIADLARQNELILDSAGEGIYVVDSEGKTVLVNPAAEEMLGWTAKELVGERHHDLIHHTRADGSPYPYQECKIYAAYVDGITHKGEDEVYWRKDGTSFPVAYTSTPIRDEVGKVTGAVVTFRDITERRQAEEERARLTTILETTADFVGIATAEGRAIYVNRAGRQMVGFGETEDVSIYTIADMQPPSAMEMLETVAIPTAVQAGVWSGESRLVNRQGQEIPVLQAIMAHKDSSGQVQYLSTIARDITEIKQAEAEVRKRAAELQTVAEVTTTASTILEPEELLQSVVDLTRDSFDLYHAHIYLLDEPASEELLKLDLQEAASTLRERELVLRAGAGKVGRLMLERGHSIPLAHEHSLVARAARTRQGVISNDVQNDPDFLPNPLLPDTRAEMAIPLVVGDKVLGVLDVQSDEIDRFTQEDVNIKTTLAGQVATALENARLFKETQGVAERLREVDRLKSEFLANMSHELRTPLNSILGYAELLVMDLETELDSESLEDLQSIQKNGKHLLALINDVLDLAKIEAGRLTLNMEEVHVEPVLEQVRSNNAGLLINKPVEMIIDAEEGLPLIQADPVRLTQVLNNLVSNAVKFTDEGSISLRAFREDGWIHIAVEDTGIGISQEDLDKIFERFQQVDGSYTRRAEGTGLGLAITRHLIQMHGGKIDVRSKLGEGSTFTLRLPVREREGQGETVD